MIPRVARYVLRTELTAREQEVLHLLARGLTNEEIAARLEISRRTVEAHVRAVFHKTGVSRRAQLVALVRDGRVPIPEYPVSQPAAPAGDPAASEPRRADEVGRPHAGQRRLELYDDVVQALTDRHVSLFEERVEITVTVGERDGLDTVVERRWTTPKPYVTYRIMCPIVPVTGPRIDPDELSLGCEVHGQDIRPEVGPMIAADGGPLVMVLFQPGLRDATEWTLRYRSPRLWNPLRGTGQDTLGWSTATTEQRHLPTVSELTVHILFPPGWADGDVTELDGLGNTDTANTPGGQLRVTWRATAPLEPKYRWALRGRP